MQPQKPRRSRARVPKAKTGCKSWSVAHVPIPACLPSLLKFYIAGCSVLTVHSKVRHLKCDEARPECNRCRKDRVKCDGYSLPSAWVHGPRNNCQQQDAFQVSTSLSIPTLVDQMPDLTYLERLYFHHALRYTVHEWGDWALKENFWNSRLPFVGLHNSVIRHAIIALGAAHRDFLSQALETPTPDRSNERFILNHYNLAIRHMLPLMSISTAENLRAGLTCCLLFVCIENLRGHYTESIRHLRAGSRVLASMLSENDPDARSMQNATLMCSSSEWHLAHTKPCKGFHDGDMDDLATLFSSLGTACSIISDEEIVPLQHIAGCRVPNTLASADSQVIPFPSLGEARQELHEITVFHDITWRQFCFPVGSTPIPPETSIRRKAAYCSIYQRFYHWSARFDAFMDHLLLQSAPAAEICDALKTRLDQKIWLALADEESWSADWNAEIKPSDLDAILADVELFNQLSPSPSQASFKFDMNLAPSLVFVGCFTEDVDLLRRVVVALKTLNRREGFWDTHDLAEIFEASITARSKYGWSIQGPQRGDILCFARSLASFNPPCIKVTNSFLRFATEMV